MKAWQERILSLASLVMVGWLFYRYALPQPSAPLDGLASQAVVAPGRVTLLELSATHCPGCMAMRPIVEAVRRNYGDRVDVRVLEIDLAEDRREAERVARLAQLRYTPTFVITDASGRAIAKYIGPTSYAALSGHLETALKPGKRGQRV